MLSHNSHTVLKDIAKYVNESKSDYDNIRKIDLIESELKDFVPGQLGVVRLQKYGRHVFDGDVRVFMESEQRISKR